MIDAARYAPSAGNLQPLEVIVIDKEELKKKIFDAALKQESILSAPVVLIMCADVKRTSIKYGERGKYLYCIQDVAAATQNLLLMATALDLGTVWVGAFNEEQIKKALNLPNNIKPLAIIPIGYYDNHPQTPYKREIAEIMHFNGW